jgi:D-glycero-alpha-D-manno-heptose-7-phosphate kinase
VRVTLGGSGKLVAQIRNGAPYGLFMAVVRFFGFHGLDVEIISEAPVQSALGGSSTALVALIKALSEVRKGLNGKGMSPDEILHLSYHIEDAVSGGNCGAQDQGAGIYGGVNQWIWTYSMPYFCKRISLLDIDSQKELSKRLLVAYTGKRHISSVTNQRWIEDFLSGRTQKGWIRVNNIVHSFANSLKERDWKGAIRYLNEEVTIRRELTPDAFIPLTETLIDQAKELGCGARFAGAGAGGCVWAIGEPQDIKKLEAIWKESLLQIEGAHLLQCKIDPGGLKS